jgi:hypothetical protein
MYFTHHIFGLVMIQTLQQKIFGGTMIKLIINQSKDESDAPNTFVSLLAWITQLISDLRSPIFLNTFWFRDQRTAATLYSVGLTGLGGGQAILPGGLTCQHGGLIGPCGGRTVRSCTE